MLCIYTCLKWKVRPVISLSNSNASGTYKYKIERNLRNKQETQKKEKNEKRTC